jgi:hypothetical protein
MVIRVGHVVLHSVAYYGLADGAWGAVHMSTLCPTLWMVPGMEREMILALPLGLFLQLSHKY